MVEARQGHKRGVWHRFYGRPGASKGAKVAWTGWSRRMFNALFE